MPDGPGRHHQKDSPSNDPEIDNIVWENTELEVHTGMVAGTLPVEESDALDRCLPHIVSSRAKTQCGTAVLVKLNVRAVARLLSSTQAKEISWQTCARSVRQGLSHLSAASRSMGVWHPRHW